MGEALLLFFHIMCDAIYSWKVDPNAENNEKLFITSLSLFSLFPFPIPLPSSIIFSHILLLPRSLFRCNSLYIFITHSDYFSLLYYLCLIFSPHSTASHCVPICQFPSVTRCPLARSSFVHINAFSLLVSSFRSLHVISIQSLPISVPSLPDTF